MARICAVWILAMFNTMASENLAIMMSLDLLLLLLLQLHLLESILRAVGKSMETRVHVIGG